MTEQQLSEALAAIRGWLEENRDLLAGSRDRRERFARSLEEFRSERSDQSRIALLADAKDYFGEWSHAYAQVRDATRPDPGGFSMPCSA